MFGQICTTLNKKIFAAQDSSGLDTWVFEKVQEFFENANASLQEKLRAAQNVFFLHLLGKLFSI